MRRTLLKKSLISMVCVLTFCSVLFLNNTGVVFAAGYMSISPTFGGGNRDLTVKGEWSATEDEGKVFFDINGNGQLDSDEPSQIMQAASYCGRWAENPCVTATLKVPDVQVGTYNVLYVSSSGNIDATPAQYRVLDPVLVSSFKEGGINEEINITAKYLPVGEQGTVYFDSNNNNQLDEGESSQSLQVGDTGSAEVKLKSANVKPGKYNIRYISSSRKIYMDPVQYDVIAASLQNYSNPSGVNTSINIIGKNLPGSDEGVIYFDSNNNNELDNGEPSQSIKTDSIGNVATSLKTPNVEPGTYNIRYESSFGTIEINSLTHRIMAPSINSSSSEGAAGKTVAVTGAYSAPYTSGTVYFDNNNNGRLDEDEVKQVVSSDSQGKFSAQVKIPNIEPGEYSIRYVSSSNPVIEKVMKFKVIGRTLIASSGSGSIGNTVFITGKNFFPYEVGTLYFDSNNNGSLDEDETKVNLTSEKDGSFYTGLIIPDVAPGDYNIGFISEGKLIKVPPTTYKVVRPLSPNVNPVSNSDKVVTGKGEPNNDVTVSLDGKLLGKSLTDNEGNFKVQIAPQEIGAVLIVKTTDKDGNESQEVKVSIQEDKTAPDAPKVNMVNDQDTMVTGLAESDSIVSVKTESKTYNGNTQTGGTFVISIEPQKAGNLLEVTAKDNAGNESKPTVVTVQDKTAPVSPKVDTVSDQSSTVTGTTEANANISVKVGTKVIGSGNADENGKYNVKISKQKAGTPIAVSAKDNEGNESKPTVVTVQDKTAPASPKVGTISDQSITVTGTTEANASVSVKVGTKTIGSGKANSKGSFSIKISKQKAGTNVSVSAKDNAGNESKSTVVTVQDKTAPASPKVNTVSDQSKTVTGTAEANASVSVKVGTKVIGSGKVDKNGKYSVKISKQKAGVKVAVSAKDNAENESKPTVVTVQDKTAPVPPKVNNISVRSTTVTGTTEANASVSVKVGTKTIGSGKANSKGAFSIKISKQKAGTKVTIIAKDNAGNESKSTKTVSK
ncbi:Ig-like domain-containing protein [Priestia megaterium]|uniref:Ig-like domain-containing protein n=1 Tax=Priestia megaterium TaxID=1404 RepID=UPI0035BE9230